MGKPRVRIIVPAVDHDEVSESLRALTRLIHKAGHADGSAGGIFGGEWGYGADFENDVFMMHRYCWCERADCPWCAGCECPDTAYHYFVDGREVRYEEWNRFYEDYVYGPGKTFHDWLERIGRHTDRERAENDRKAKEANARRSTKHDAVCRVCRGEFGHAPNFHHKPSGTTVRWYKYIGRGMETDIRAPWGQIIAECRASLRADGGSQRG